VWRPLVMEGVFGDGVWVVGGPDLSPQWAMLSRSFSRYLVPLEPVKVGRGAFSLTHSRSARRKSNLRAFAERVSN
jgi:hypothetical protein